MSTAKTSWPEVVGWPAAQAVTQVGTDRPDVAIEVLPSGTSVAPGFNRERVRVFFDGTGSVAATPVVG
uniref:Subtilisin inhibitor 1 n=1 Tax=Hordeum vulgare subsp. vulgare TaxID=112509 RepID=A0A8I6XUT6_HORVV